MAFPRDEISKLLAQCHRRCCICHRFCGVKMEIDHIVPKEQSGEDNCDNAIPVCFECHAEIHSYNDKHPRGRKFTPDELRTHRTQWLKICAEHPEVLIAPTRNADVGPLQALIDELAFNSIIASRLEPKVQGGTFYNNEFRRAIQQGSIAILHDEVRDAILDAYVAMETANGIINAALRHGESPNLRAIAINDAQKRIQQAAPKIKNASDKLLEFLCSETRDD